MNNYGILYVVATPIGNINDMSPRAIATLNKVELILCEDTRHSSPLFQQYGIKKPLQALHDHNEKDKAAHIITMLKEGKNLAIVSDAGTPLISDPGYFVISLCHQEGIKVSPIPGPSAVITALSAAGLPSDTFTFYGFLPTKSKGRCEKFTAIKFLPATAIFYESTHRIIESLKDLIAVLGAERRVCLARELTKQFETIITATAQEILTYLESNYDHTRGEFVVIIEGGKKQKSVLTPEITNLLLELAKELPPKKAVKIVSNSFALDRNELYNLIVANKS